MHISGRPLCFKSIPEGYVEKTKQEEQAKLPQAIVEFFKSRFLKEN